MNAINFLDCGCAIMADGSRSFCPSCDSPPPCSHAEPAADSTPRDTAEDVFFIEDGSGIGNLAHCRKAAHQYLDAMLDGLKAGDGTGATEFTEVIKFEYRRMTKEEQEALPEV